jgi:hypothetical protein
MERENMTECIECEKEIKGKVYWIKLKSGKFPNCKKDYVDFMKWRKARNKWIEKYG